MTAVTAGGYGPAGVLEVSGTARVPFDRLVRVELRKMWDTRAGLWLLVTIGLVTAIVVTIFLLAANEVDRTFLNLLQASGGPQAVLLPVLGILLVTQEWGQRTGMVTFALEPHRGRVIWAKVVAALLFGVGALVLALAVAAVGTVLAGGPDAWSGFGVDDVLKVALAQLSGLIQGLAFGLLILNSAGAIVAYFALPTAFSILANAWSALKDAAPWIDFGTSQPFLLEGDHLTGEQWAQLATSALLWVVLPFLAGLWRVLRAEVK